MSLDPPINMEHEPIRLAKERLPYYAIVLPIGFFSKEEL
jgi:hypothetical protein